MNTRKSFIQNTALAVAGLTILSKNIFSKENNYLNKSKKLIILDSVRKDDILSNYNSIIFANKTQKKYLYENVYTIANLDFHESSINLITDLNSCTIVDINNDNPIQHNFHKLVITGFDVAHYNHQKYLSNVQATFSFLSEVISKLDDKSELLIISSMGRDDQENSCNGYDHHTISAKECWALRIGGNSIESEPIIIDTRLSTNELVTNYISNNIL